jgi:hypothetical protein
VCVCVRERERERESERERERERELEILGLETILVRIMIALERFSYFVGRESSKSDVISRVIISIIINHLSHSLDITFI